MRLAVIAVGERMPRWIRAGWDEYRRRLPRHLSLELNAVSPASATRRGSPSAMEARALLKQAPEKGIRVALDPGGQAWTTAELAERLARWQQEGGPVSLFIGGAAGLDDSVLSACQERWSLGPLTLPHMLVRVIVAEQLYRAWTILAGHPYHRG